MRVPVNTMFYPSNILRNLENWTLLTNATITTAKMIRISSGGNAGCQIINTYNNGLGASKYWRLSIELALANYSESFRWQNFVDLVLIGDYTNPQGEVQHVWHSVNMDEEYVTRTQSGILLNYSFDSEDIVYNSLSVYVFNRTTDDIIIVQCTLNRSQDISTSQVGQSVNFGVTLEEVVEYLNGAELYFQGSTVPTKLFWVEDEEGKFAGINVNNERIIKFGRTGEVLTDD